jgi:hypothetical protein
MNLIRCVTLCVDGIARATGRYATWFDYTVVEEGTLSDALAQSWGAAAMAGRRYAVMRPASGLPVDLRFVEAPPVPEFRALRTYGWSAIELCIQDVHATHAHLAESPFEVIGPPSEVAGLPTIHPMQVLGTDDEVVYLTQILESGPATGLPEAHAPIDRAFIVVLACADLDRSARWCVDQLGVRIVDDLSIPYRMLNQSFDLPVGTQHRLITCAEGDDIFIELDQYPVQAIRRPTLPQHLPPGIALCTLSHPDIDAILGPWLTAPVARDGAIYEGRRVGVLQSPEGALFEVVEG